MSSDLQERVQAALGDAYRLERELARGGMSRLFLATESSLNRQVVVKVLPPDITSKVSTDRFRQEIELAAHLQHPNILPVLTAGTRENLLYYVIPYVPGESLRHRLTREGRLPVSDAIRILHEMADALACAHAEGVIHRDIKPENILLEGSHAVLTDFGVARALGEARSGGRLTDTGLAVGTPGYMAPEQAAGDRQIDGRADVYALAVVGYEMLAGVPPFAAASAQGMLVAHLTETPRPLQDLRADTPLRVANVISRALAKDPNVRLRTAAELRDALRPPDVSERGPRIRLRFVPAAVAVLVLLLAVVAMFVFPRRAPPKLDPALIAIAPFDVLAPDLSVWREGLVDLLSRNLDGAGPLRTVSPTVVIRRWTGRADPASAAALGRATGAGLTIFGSVVGLSRDSFRLDATIHDAARGRSIGEVRLTGESAHMARLADTLAVSILRELGRTRDVTAVRTAGLRTTSVPALKAFLEGEQLYRRGAWDSAHAAYQRALELDSTFVPALRHLGQSAWWRAPGDIDYVEYLLRAGELNHGLPRRDSLLVASDSIFGALSRLDSIPAVVRRRLAARLSATLKEAVRQYPHDPEIWYEVGEVGVHVGWLLGTTRAEMLEAFDRSIALDSAFTPAYNHTVQLALITQGLEGWRRYAKPYLALKPSDDYANGIAMLHAIFSSIPGDSVRIDSIIRAANPVRLLDGVFATQEFYDSAETSIRLARALLTARGHATGIAGSPLLRRQTLAWTLAHRGRVREALRLIDGEDRLAFIPAAPAEIALVGGAPADSFATVFRDWLQRRPLWAPGSPPGFGPPSPLLFVLPWWAARGDTFSIKHFAQRSDSASRATEWPLWSEMARYGVSAARAYLVLARGDTAAALSSFQALPHDVWWGALDRVTLGQLLTRMRRDSQALRTFDEAFPHDWAGPVRVLVRLDAGRAAERLGESDRAIASYKLVLDAWRHADPELQSYVAEAREGLHRLTTEPRR